MDELSIADSPLRVTPQAPQTAERRSGVADFASRLVDAVGDANRLQQQAEGRVRELARGEGDTVETMVALSKADLALRFVVQLRNRALEAYQEIMRLQF